MKVALICDRSVLRIGWSVDRCGAPLNRGRWRLQAIRRCAELHAPDRPGRRPLRWQRPPAGLRHHAVFPALDSRLRQAARRWPSAPALLTFRYSVQVQMLAPCSDDWAVAFAGLGFHPWYQGADACDARKATGCHSIEEFREHHMSHTAAAARHRRGRGAPRPAYDPPCHDRWQRGEIGSEARRGHPPTHCANIHPGESGGVRANLGRYVLAAHRLMTGVSRASAQPAGAPGAGCPSARAGGTAAVPGARERTYISPSTPLHGTHGTRVKDQTRVYLPDWRDLQRLRYTNLLRCRPAGRAAAAGARRAEPAPPGRYMHRARSAYKAALTGLQWTWPRWSSTRCRHRGPSGRAAPAQRAV